MAITKTLTRNGETIYRGLSTDTKPTLDPLEVNATFEVLNATTKTVDEIWVWQTNDWYKY